MRKKCFGDEKNFVKFVTEYPILLYNYSFLSKNSLLITLKGNIQNFIPNTVLTNLLLSKVNSKKFGLEILPKRHVEKIDEYIFVQNFNEICEASASELVKLCAV